MKIGTIILSIFVAIVFAGTAFAVVPGKKIEYAGGDAGKVIFSGDTHGVKQGMKCNECHPKPFAMKKGAFKMTKEDHGKPEYCGICHDGTKAFSQSAEADCGKCHMKAAAEPEKQPEVAPEKKPELAPEMKPELAPEKIKEAAPAAMEEKK
jgi:c(7)-type cytochrome triheme protein